MWCSILEVIGIYLCCTIAAERITEVISSGEIFSPFRAWLANKAYSDGIKINKEYVFLHKMITCGYCLSHWTSLLFVFVLPGDYFSILMLAKWFALVGLSNLYHSIYELIRRGRVFTADIKLINTTEYLEEDDEEGTEIEI